MHPAADSSHPVHSIFGAGFIPEHHMEGDQRKLVLAEQERLFADFVRSLHGLVFGEATKH